MGESLLKLTVISYFYLLLNRFNVYLLLFLSAKEMRAKVVLTKEKKQKRTRETKQAVVYPSHLVYSRIIEAISAKDTESVLTVYSYYGRNFSNIVCLPARLFPLVNSLTQTKQIFFSQKNGTTYIFYILH